MPQFKCLSHIYSKADSHQEQLKKVQNHLTGTIHMGCSNLKQIHDAYVDVSLRLNEFV